MNLHLHVKTEYFEAIKSGSKTEEYRLDTPYWRQRLTGRDYESVIIYNAYKPGLENRLTFPWSGANITQLTHKHFGSESVSVFAIPLTQP